MSTKFGNPVYRLLSLTCKAGDTIDFDGALMVPVDAYSYEVCVIDTKSPLGGRVRQSSYAPRRVVITEVYYSITLTTTGDEKVAISDDAGDEVVAAAGETDSLVEVFRHIFKVPVVMESSIISSPDARPLLAEFPMSRVFPDIGNRGGHKIIQFIH